MKLVGEALRAAAAQPVATSVIALIVAGVCAVILSTTGQTVKAEQDVLARIDDAGTRSIVITDIDGTAAITSAAVERITGLQGVEWVIGLGPASDVHNIGNPEGSPAAIRILYGPLPPQLQADTEPEPGQALVGSQAQTSLRMLFPYGGVEGAIDYPVIGEFTAADPLAFLNRSLLTRTDQVGQVRSLHILVQRPDLVAPVTRAALTLVAAEDPTSVSVETSQVLAEVRAAVQGELGRYGRQLVSLVLAAGLVLTALSVYGSVTSRRRDFGRRRALGASRPFIITLVSTQTGLAATVGAVVGTTATSMALITSTGVAPDLPFTVATATLAILIAVMAAIPPAFVAAFRDPVRVLRVP